MPSLSPAVVVVVPAVPALLAVPVVMVLRAAPPLAVTARAPIREAGQTAPVRAEAATSRQAQPGVPVAQAALEKTRMQVTADLATAVAAKEALTRAVAAREAHMPTAPI